MKKKRLFYVKLCVLWNTDKNNQKIVKLLLSILNTLLDIKSFLFFIKSKQIVIWFLFYDLSEKKTIPMPLELWNLWLYRKIELPTQ